MALSPTISPNNPVSSGRALVPQPGLYTHPFRLITIIAGLAVGLLACSNAANVQGRLVRGQGITVAFASLHFAVIRLYSASKWPRNFGTLRN